MQLILTKLPSGRRAHSLNGTMGYESAADETAFVFGPLVVGLLATTLNPAAPMIGAAVLTLVFVTAFALHPTAKVAAPTTEEPVVQAPARSCAASACWWSSRAPSAWACSSAPC